MNIETYKKKCGKFIIYKIPLYNIEKCNVSLVDKNKTWSLLKHAKSNNWDLGVNGAMFDMNTYQNVTDLIVGGVLNNGGNYSDVGLAFGNDFPKIGCYRSKTSYSIGNPVDFIGGAPTLLIDGEINLDMKGIGSSFATTSTQRTAVGVDGKNLYIISTVKNKATLNEVANELLKQGCVDAINLDGGASTALYVDGKVIYSGRNIPSAIGVKLKTKEEEVESEKLYKVQVGAFRNKSNAENLKKQFNDLGYDAFITYQ